MAQTRIAQQRIDDCRELYLKYGGRRHELIESEMRALGYKRFSRRIMHTRRERGTTRPGWIERFGWRQAITKEQLRITNSENPSSNDGRDPNIRNSSFAIRNS